MKGNAFIMFKKIAHSFLFIILFMFAPISAFSQGTLSETYSSDDLIKTGGQFFGEITQGLASLVEKTVSQYGLPNAYILGQEASGALFAGARYGEGTMSTRNAGSRSVFWQGPSIGFDVGGDGSKVMMLIYNLPSVDAIYGRYPGVDGSAYVVGGLGITAMKYDNIYIVPIRSGLGARLGVNVGYLKFTQQPTWNPF